MKGANNMTYRHERQMKKRAQRDVQDFLDNLYVDFALHLDTFYGTASGKPADALSCDTDNEQETDNG